jgi:photosystem II stability/assembly factor-like uncharacterized protein
MSIEDRIRESMHRAIRPASPSADAWASIERSAARRKRRTAALWLAGGAVIALAFLAAITWVALTLRENHQVVGHQKRQLTVSNIRVFADRGFAKVGGVVASPLDHAVGASIKCQLRDAAEKLVGTVTGTVPFIRAGGSSHDQTIAAGPTKGVAAGAACAALAIAPTPPPAPAPPQFWPTGVAFFDQQHGILVGRFGTSGCDRGCLGWIEITSDGGKTWTRIRETPSPITSVTVFGPSDAWAIENETCAYICPALLRSTDGGRTWTNLGEVSVTDPSFVSPDVGFALGYQRNQTTAPVVTSRDGGRTWTQLGSPCRAVRWASTSAALSFATVDRGWLMCEGEGATDMAGKALFETTDGARSWNMVAAAPIHATVPSSVGEVPIIGYLPGMFFTPDGHGWLWLERGSLSATIDGGQSWTTPSDIIQVDVNEFSSAWFVNDTTGYAILFQQPMELLRTTDVGHTWSALHRWRQRS